MAEGRVEAGKLRVFISYSRDDLNFADQLDIALRYCGFDCTIDRHGVSAGEDWQRRLRTLISEADTVVFVLSPSSAQSDICAWEVEEAVRLNKRIVPVLCRPLNEASPPPQLKSINYIFFYSEEKSPGSGFGQGLEQLGTALRTDLGWLREHTRLLVRAKEWEAAGRLANRMLVGPDIQAAKAWADNRPHGAPEPTELHHDFIRESEQAEADRLDTERRRLEDLAAAEGARADALKEAEIAQSERAAAMHRLLRRTWGSLIVTVVLTAFAGGAGWLYKIYEDRQSILQEARRTNLRGQIIAYGTAPGTVAVDAMEGQKTSPYTTNLVRFLSHKDKSIDQTLAELTDQVNLDSWGRQRPYISSSLNGHIYLWHQPASRAKVALVVSVDHQGFTNRRLNAPRHDSDAIVKLLREMGFTPDEIVQRHNPNLDNMRTLIDAIRQQISAKKTSSRIRGLARSDAEFGDTLFFFFFSGNGVRFDGQDRMIFELASTIKSADHTISNSLDVRRFAAGIEQLFSTSVLILDTNFLDASQIKKLYGIDLDASAGSSAR